MSYSCVLTPTTAPAIWQKLNEYLFNSREVLLSIDRLTPHLASPWWRLSHLQMALFFQPLYSHALFLLLSDACVLIFITYPFKTLTIRQ